MGYCAIHAWWMSQSSWYVRKVSKTRSDRGEFGFVLYKQIIAETITVILGCSSWWHAWWYDYRSSSTIQKGRREDAHSLTPRAVVVQNRMSVELKLGPIIEAQTLIDTRNFFRDTIHGASSTTWGDGFAKQVMSLVLGIHLIMWSGILSVSCRLYG